MKRTLLTSAVAGSALCVAATVSVANVSCPYQTSGAQFCAHDANGRVVILMTGIYGAMAPAPHRARHSRTRPSALFQPLGQVGDDPRGKWEGYPGWRWEGDPRWHWDGYPRWLWHG